MTALDERKIKIITVSAVIILIVMIIALVANIIGAGVLKSRENKLKAELAILHSQNEQIQGEINTHSTDAYVEQYARDILNMVRPDEKVIIFQ